MSEPNHPLHADLCRLLRELSVSVGSFTLASGRQSSYYIDARRTTMSSQGIYLIGTVGLLAIREAGWGADAVGGLTLGADPVAYAVARASVDAPPPVEAFTVRKEAKAHGAKRRIEGRFEKGMAVVVVEDVVTTGGSALNAIEAVRDGGANVLGVLAVVDRDEGGREAITEAGFSLRSLVSLADLGLPPERHTS